MQTGTKIRFLRMVRLRKAFTASFWIICFCLLWIFIKSSCNSRPELIYNGVSYIFQKTRSISKESMINENGTTHLQKKLDGGLLEDFFQTAQNAWRKYKFSDVQAGTANDAKQILQKDELKDVSNDTNNYDDTQPKTSPCTPPASKSTEPTMHKTQQGKLNDTLRNHHYHSLNASSQLKSLFETNFAVIDSKDIISVTEMHKSFVLVIPRFTKVVETIDQKASIVAASLLRSLVNFDGIACLPRRMKHKKTSSFNTESSNQNWKSLFNSTWCNFLKRNWSIQIRNSGPLEKFTIQKYNFVFQFCNIVNGPFVINTKTFRKIGGLSSAFGRLTLLDFFLRSGGQLKIGKTSGCYFSDHLFDIDRGQFERIRKGDFPEYSNFGVAHKVLRIITEDEIQWTKCVATDKLCIEVPYLGPPTTLPRIAQPICCSVLLGEILKDVVKVFTKLGIKYRVLFSTLLGGERSGAIIPYTHDVDFTLQKKYADNQSSYDSLQKYFGKKYHISGYSFYDFPRLIPLFPAHLSITTGPLFKDEYDLRGDDFFSRDVNDSIREFLSFSRTDWQTRTYADFYRYDERYWTGSCTTTINGENYTTVNHKHEMLYKWYGSDWNRPILKHFKEQSREGQAPDNSTP